MSLYNETDGRAIFPTPVLAVVGLIEDASRVLRRSFVDDGDFVYLLGETGRRHRRQRVPEDDPRPHRRAGRRSSTWRRSGGCTRCWPRARRSGVLLSAHDPSDGGLGVALAECCFAGEEPGRGARIDLPAGLPADRLLFSETPSRAVVTTRDELRIAELARRHGVRWARIGVVGGDRLAVAVAGQALLDQPVAALHEAWMSLDGALAHNI